MKEVSVYSHTKTRHDDRGARYLAKREGNVFLAGVADAHGTLIAEGFPSTRTLAMIRDDVCCEGTSSYERRLAAAFIHAHKDVREQAGDTHAGTTCTFALLDLEWQGDTRIPVAVGHVGTSRLYCVTDENAQLLTEDEYALEYCDESERRIPDMLGDGHALVNHVFTFRLHKGETLLFTADVLPDTVDEERLFTIIQTAKTLAHAGKRLAKEIVRAQGDEPTFILLSYDAAKRAKTRKVKHAVVQTPTHSQKAAHNTTPTQTPTPLPRVRKTWKKRVTLAVAAVVALAMLVLGVLRIPPLIRTIIASREKEEVPAEQTLATNTVVHGIPIGRIYHRAEKDYAYTSSAPILILETDEQELSLFKGETLIRTFPVSTGRKGEGGSIGSGTTPLGYLRVYDKRGEGIRIGTAFEDNGTPLTNRGPVKIIRDKTSIYGMKTTRILLLEGLEPGKNKGGDVDTRARGIWITGTDKEWFVNNKTKSSSGNIRMRNDDVITLFNAVPTNTILYVE